VYSKSGEPIISRSLRDRVQSVLAFILHQIVATEGVIWLTILGTFLLRGSIAEVHEPWVHSAFFRGIHLILSNTPFFPVQIATGAYLGSRLYLRWRHRSMLWVWILPGTVLIYVMLSVPTFGSLPSSLGDAGPFSHYLGWGCQADRHCYDQLTFTQPFYTSVAYALGALAAQKFKPPLRSAASD
jgi:hypothetical protein